MFYKFFQNFYYFILEKFHRQPTGEHFCLVLFLLLLSKYAIFNQVLKLYRILKIQFIDQIEQHYFLL